MKRRDWPQSTRCCYADDATDWPDCCPFDDGCCYEAHGPKDECVFAIEKEPKR